MIREDKYYRDLGFKCGLEIHQQLLTDKKLYCRCPAGYRNDKHNGEIIRHMRPTLSELGEYDGTALMEFKTKKNVTYQLYTENSCTYEMDDTPPFPINRDALNIALKLAMLLNCAIVDELHVSRKQYLDGSIPGGFQRTAIVGVGGWVPYKNRKITITHICLEEDACREISDNGHEIVFRTDRLSMPLIEVITAPDMLTPKEAMEVNKLIGRILKNSGLVRRGIGSVRQDVNVSINGGDRAEIKGVPKTSMVVELTAIEADRQKALLEIKEILRKRGISDKTIHNQKIDLTKALDNSDNDIVSKLIENNLTIKGIKLEGFAGVMSSEIQPGRSLADEFSGRVQVIACLDQMPNIAVSDIDNNIISDDNWSKIRKDCGCKHTDTVVVVWGSEADVDTALAEIKIRAIETSKGVPQETRQAIGNGVTGFERILPGPDRMYPDTDSPSVQITENDVAKLKLELSPPSYELENKWIELGVQVEIAYKAVVSDYRKFFDIAVRELKLNGNFVWSILGHLNKNNSSDVLSYDNLLSLFTAYNKGVITKDSICKITKDFNNDKSKPIEKHISDNKIISIDNSKVIDISNKYLKESTEIKFSSGQSRINYICGNVKKEFDFRLDGSLLQKNIAGKLK